MREIACIAAREAAHVGISPQAAVEYLSQNLHFWMGSAERNGLALFHRLASRMGLAPEATVPRYRAAAMMRGVGEKTAAAMRS